MSVVLQVGKKLTEFEGFRERFDSFSLSRREWWQLIMFDLGGPEAIIEEAIGKLPEDPLEFTKLFQAVDDGLEKAVRDFMVIPEEVIHEKLRSVLAMRRLHLNGFGASFELPEDVLAQEFKRRLRIAEGGLVLTLKEEDALGQRVASIMKSYWAEELKMDGLLDMPFSAAAVLAAVSNVNESPVIHDLRGTLVAYYDGIFKEATPAVFEWLEEKARTESPDYLGSIEKEILLVAAELKGKPLPLKEESFYAR